MPFTLAPMADKRTGAEAPIATPISRGSAESRVIAPDRDKACRIPTAADADWSMAVIATPTRIPRTGLRMEVRRFRNQGAFPRALTEPLMVLIPNIRIEKPIRMLPV